MGQYASDLFEVMKSGAVVGGGLVVHKALTNVLLDQAFKKVDFLQKLNPKYQRSLAAVVVAAVGIPLSTKFGGSLGKKLSMGMGAALIHTVFSEILGSAKPAYQHYLGSYTEADKSFGSYYEFQPGQSYSGMGEYIQQSGSMAGFIKLRLGSVRLRFSKRLPASASTSFKVRKASASTRKFAPSLPPRRTSERALRLASAMQSTR
jgi:hypothetical protein